MINKVDGPGSVRGPQNVRRTGRTDKGSSTAFSQHLQDESAGASQAVSGMSAVGGISALLGIQEVDDATQRASKGKKRASQLLEQLDDVRMGLVSGVLSKDQLMRLSNLVQSEKQNVDDPRLAEILDDIDLRARVELAKYGF